MTLADILAGIIFVALNAYALLGGADFGGGVWDLLARGPRQGRPRELIADAIGPVWEANPVWLILAIVLLFPCFPPAFARLGTLLHIPLSLVLIGIVLRGSAFTFWRYGGGAHGDREQRRWGLLFAVARLITPLLLGATVGAIASGRLGEGGRGTGDGFYATYVASWRSRPRRPPRRGGEGVAGRRGGGARAAPLRPPARQKVGGGGGPRRHTAPRARRGGLGCGSAAAVALLSVSGVQGASSVVS